MILICKLTYLKRSNQVFETECFTNESSEGRPLKPIKFRIMFHNNWQALNIIELLEESQNTMEASYTKVGHIKEKKTNTKTQPPFLPLVPRVANLPFPRFPPHAYFLPARGVPINPAPKIKINMVSF